MTRSEKVEIIAKLQEEFKISEAIVVCNYKGLSTKKLEELRNNARENNVKVQIIKNTLANIALNNSGKTGLVLKDTNVYLWGEDQLSVSKVAAKFEENNDKLKLKLLILKAKLQMLLRLELWQNAFSQRVACYAFASLECANYQFHYWFKCA